MLIEAAYRNELAKLCDAASQLLETMPPQQALRAWMGRFIDYATAEFGMADALRALVESGVDPYVRSKEMMLDALAALAALLDAAARAGTIRPDIGATDMFAALTGIALASGKPGHREQAERTIRRRRE
ncbi:SbtR family transcriptional regulator [Nocardia sp. NPDC004750]